MTLHRELTAQCDGDENTCEEYVDLNPDDTQPFRTLTEWGWSADHGVTDPDVILTFCPKHKEQAR